MFAVHRIGWKNGDTVPLPQGYVEIRHNDNDISVFAIDKSQIPTLYKLKCLAQRDVNILNAKRSFIYIYAVTKYIR